MSKKRRIFTASFKIQIVLEVLKNAEVSMEPAKAVQEYKDEVANLKVKVGEYAKKVGELTLEKD